MTDAKANSPILSVWHRHVHWPIPLLAFMALILIIITQSNQPLFIALNAYLQPFGPIFWANATVLGDTLILCCLLLPFFYYHPKLLQATLLGGLLTTIIVHGIKQGLGLLRPGATFAADQIYIIGSAATSSPAFPSGHTATATLFAAVIALHWQRFSITLLAVSFALLVAISRIAVGAHWPLDVLGGIIVGWSCAVVGMSVTQRKCWLANNTSKVIINLILISAALILLLVYETHYPHTQYLTVIIAVISLLLSIQNLTRIKYP